MILFMNHRDTETQRIFQRLDAGGLRSRPRCRATKNENERRNRSQTRRSFSFFAARPAASRRRVELSAFSVPLWFF